ncbi:GT2 family glycosyltransferase [Aliiruegeria haliotis]|uniref:GT2 family glycosyltransferase n=1 Tax=Aliiruegeria haliotis TaxID=1280846 RepID=A0A2T0RSZ7_9RHOB|nr:glycosyltransferase family 2 protein [Aliiruegeria haliotis]PRY24230.1 GT2 family glycosyltransferase [Aliiruegeria haliotis]
MTRRPDPVPAEIAVITVNYGTAALALEAVESVLAADHGGRGIEVHLVDNASPDDDAQAIRAAAGQRGWGDRVHLYFEEENHGFARGNNLVFRALEQRDTPPDKVFLLNPDARLGNEAMERLADYLDEHPQTATVGARISMPGGRAVTSAFRFPGMISVLAETANFGPISRLFERYVVPLRPEQPTGPVDWVSGAAVMFRFAPIREAGFFDPDYFLYFEEVDLQWRLARAGWGSALVAEAHVIHEEGAATRIRSDESRTARPDYWYNSHRIFLRTTLGRSRAALTAAAMLPAAWMNHLHSAVRGRTVHLPADFIRDHCRVVLKPLLLGERSEPPGRIGGAGGHG